MKLLSISLLVLISSCESNKSPEAATTPIQATPEDAVLEHSDGLGEDSSYSNMPLDSMHVEYGDSTYLLHGRRSGNNLLVGDISFPIPENKELTGVGLKVNLWPIKRDTIVVTYDFASNVDNALQKSILAGMALWSAQVRVKFVRRKQETKGYVLYKRITTGRSSSTIGCYNTVTDASILNTASIGTIAHEMGHTLGLFHEQNRHDRNKYVVVEGECLKEDNYSLVLKNSTRYANPGAYNYQSIMHYPKKAGCFEVKKSAIPAGNPIPIIGQRQRVTTEDAATVISLYGLS